MTWDTLSFLTAWISFRLNMKTPDYKAIYVRVVLWLLTLIYQEWSGARTDVTEQFNCTFCRIVGTEIYDSMTILVAHYWGPTSCIFSKKANIFTYWNLFRIVFVNAAPYTTAAPYTILPHWFEPLFAVIKSFCEGNLTCVVRKSTSLGLKREVRSSLCYNDCPVSTFSSWYFLITHWISASFDTKHACILQHSN